MEVPKIFKGKEKELDHVSTSDHIIDLKEVDEKIKSQNQEWLDKNRKENERQAAKNKPREEAIQRVSKLREQARIEQFEVNRIKGKYNQNRELMEKISQENREYEKEIEKYGGWKKVSGPKQTEWKKEFACFNKTPFELEEQAIRMKATGHIKNEKGEWVMDPERQKLNEIIAQEVRKG